MQGGCLVLTSFHFATRLVDKGKKCMKKYKNLIALLLLLFPFYSSASSTVKFPPSSSIKPDINGVAFIAAFYDPTDGGSKGTIWITPDGYVKITNVPVYNARQAQGVSAKKLKDLMGKNPDIKAAFCKYYAPDIFGSYLRCL